MSTEIIILLVVVAFIVIFLFNNLVSKKNKVESSLSTIDTYFKKRIDLLEPLYVQLERELDHESETYKAIAKNRTGFDEVRRIHDAKASNPNAIIEADRMVSTMFQGMRSTMEQYPQLQSIQAVMQVMTQTITVENELNASRRQYNANVTTYRNAIQTFPNLIIANMLGFKDVYELYKADEADKIRPKSPSEDYYKAKFAKKTEDLQKEDKE